MWRPRSVGLAAHVVSDRRHSCALAGAQSDTTAQCQAGKQATGGGAWVSSKELSVDVSLPWAAAGGPSTNWRSAQVFNSSAVQTHQYSVYVICAS
jgi:hypothetical protein